MDATRMIAPLVKSGLAGATELASGSAGNDKLMEGRSCLL